MSSQPADGGKLTKKANAMNQTEERRPLSPIPALHETEDVVGGHTSQPNGGDEQDQPSSATGDSASDSLRQRQEHRAFFEPPMSPLLGPGGDASSRGSYGYSFAGYSESIDSAFAWLAESRHQHPSLRDDHPLFPLVDIAMPMVARMFRVWMEASGQDGVSVAAKNESLSTSGSQAGSSIGSRKRSRPASVGRQLLNRHGGGDEDDDDEGDKWTSSRKNSGRSEPEDQARPLACPFFKKDPVVHQPCYKYRLMRIRDVKQHVGRKHSLPIYCPICFETFYGEEQRDAHVRVANECSSRQAPRPQGVTEDQKRRLGRRAPSTQTVEEQWYGIFDILFDKTQVARPTSPYLDTHQALLSGALKYQEFVEGPGVEILRNVLTDSGAITWNLPDDERDLQSFQQNILERGLRMMFEQWAAAPIGPVNSSPESHPTTAPTSEAAVESPAAHSEHVGQQHGQQHGPGDEEELIHVRPVSPIDGPARGPSLMGQAAAFLPRYGAVDPFYYIPTAFSQSASQALSGPRPSWFHDPASSMHEDLNTVFEISIREVGNGSNPRGNRPGLEGPSGG